MVPNRAKQQISYLSTLAACNSSRNSNNFLISKFSLLWKQRKAAKNNFKANKKDTKKMLGSFHSRLAIKVPEKFQ